MEQGLHHTPLRFGAAPWWDGLNIYRGVKSVLHPVESLWANILLGSLRHRVHYVEKRRHPSRCKTKGTSVNFPRHFSLVNCDIAFVGPGHAQTFVVNKRTCKIISTEPLVLMPTSAISCTPTRRFCFTIFSTAGQFTSYAASDGRLNQGSSSLRFLLLWWNPAPDRGI